MASLHKLLSEDGFSHSQQNSNKKPASKKKVKFKDRRRSVQQQDSIPLPIYICHDRRSFNYPRQKKPESLKGSSVISSQRGGGSGSERSMISSVARKDEPAIDEVAVKAMVSMLSGYIGQYVKDRNFRHSIREKCCVCFEIMETKTTGSDCKEMSAHMEIGIQSIENLVENEVTLMELDLESLEYIIKVFKIVASSSIRSDDSYLSACAHLYLAIVYKIAKNDKVSARYILQVFVDSPFLARTHLIPEVWQHFFLPHLLHLKIWCNNEMEVIENSGHVDKKKKIEALYEQYNDHVDDGTMQFARYYKEWLKIGSRASSVPSVPLPSKSRHARSRRRSLGSSSPYKSAKNEELYQKVFGNVTKKHSMDLDNENRVSSNVWDREEIIKYYIEKKPVSPHERPSRYMTQKQEFWSENQRSDYFKFLACRTEPEESYIAQGYYISSEAKINNDAIDNTRSNDVSKAISTICSSDSLRDCERAVRVIGEAWLDSNGDIILEKTMVQSSFIQGLMEVLHICEDDEISELVISILAELANKNDANKQCVLNLDPNLDIFMRLLRSGSLFLKASVLLYMIRPKANQMMSVEWIPLILRVLEFGDQFQTLFSVRCNPHEAAYYFLEQILTGFDEDRNSKNANQIVSLGGMSLLVKRIDLGDNCEKRKAVFLLNCCVRSDGTCRHYLAKNLKKDSILALLALGKKSDDHEHVLALFTELLCLNRTNQRIELLDEIREGWDCLNAMHVFLIILHRAKPEERPIVAVILLQLDLLGEPSEYSIYREEAIDAIIHALSCSVLDERIQEQSTRALITLAGHFSYKGESEIETWLLTKAGLTENSSCERDITTNEHTFLNEEDKIRETWQRKVAIALLSGGNKRLLSSLSDSIAYGVPRLKRASLVTVCWISNHIQSVGDKDFGFNACAIFVPGLLELLRNSSSVEEKILASFSLLNLTKRTDYLSRLNRVREEILACLHKLSQLTWTAMELVSLITSSSKHQVRYN